MSLQTRLTLEATILRGSIVAGKRQAPMTHLVGLKCTQLYPADGGRVGALIEQGLLHSLANAYEAFLGGMHDIKSGDVLRVNGESYTVAAPAPWKKPNSDEYFMHLTVEKILQ